MSSDPASGNPQAQGPPGEPSEEEMRAAYEAELASITVTDMIAQAAVSLLNLAARRLGPPPDAAAPPAGAAQAQGRDLEQVRDGIDGARALLEVLERRIPQEVRPLRDALSQLQIAYASAVGAEGPAGGATAAPPTGHEAPRAPAGAGAEAAPRPPGAPGSEAGSEGEDSGPGPAEQSGRLWVPGR